jgi:hypothetical protein
MEQEVTMKPHKGRIDKWGKLEIGRSGLGYVIFGRFLDHETIRDGFTSIVLAHDPATGEIETRNSRYTLIGQDG